MKAEELLSKLTDIDVMMNFGPDERKEAVELILAFGAEAHRAGRAEGMMDLYEEIKTQCQAEIAKQSLANPKPTEAPNE